MNFKVEKGIVQDATFITSDPSHTKADAPRDDEAKTRRSRDGALAKKRLVAILEIMHASS